MYKELIPTERQEHLSLMQWVRTQPKVYMYFIHIPNEGKRDAKSGYILARMGLRRGVSDFFLAYPIQPYGGLWIELKRQKFGVTSEYQKAWIELMRNTGYKAEIAYGWEDAKRIIEEYMASFT